MNITADFSHWTCVIESWLENSPLIIEEAVKRTKHVHARAGYTQGPQVPDPTQGLQLGRNLLISFSIFGNK